MLSRFVLRGGVALYLVTLSACAGATVITRIDYTPYYSPNLVQYLTQHGELTTVIHGNPIGAPQAVNAEAIAKVMKSPGWFTRFRFTTNPGSNTRKDIRIVLVFNPVHPAPGGPAVCEKNGDLPVKADTSRVRVQAAFCDGDDPITQLFAEGPAVKGLDDPYFDSFMRQTVATLLPRHNPEDDPPGTTGPNWWD